MFTERVSGMPPILNPFFSNTSAEATLNSITVALVTVV
jgi:hypothetical protein